MRITALVLGLIAAAMVLIAGCGGFVFGSCAVSFEEAFEIEEDSNGATSTSSDVQSAGAVAILFSIPMFVGAGIAMVALRTSLALLVVSFLLALVLVFIDTTSVFAALYYLAIVLLGVCIILMAVDVKRSRAGPSIPDPG